MLSLGVCSHVGAKSAPRFDNRYHVRTGGEERRKESNFLILVWCWDPECIYSVSSVRAMVVARPSPLFSLQLEIWRSCSPQAPTLLGPYPDRRKIYINIHQFCVCVGPFGTFTSLLPFIFSSILSLLFSTQPTGASIFLKNSLPQI